MQTKNPLIPWLVLIAAVVVFSLAIQPVAALFGNNTSGVANSSNGGALSYALDAGLPAAIAEAPANVSAISLDFQNKDLGQAVPVKVDAALAYPTNVQATFEATLLKLINAERAKQGLKKLALQSKLTKAAESHSRDMATKNFFSHTGSNGSSLTDRFDKLGYKWSAAGETIYAGGGTYNTPKQCLDAWLNSPSHRDIMLSSAYTQIGLGYVYNSKSSYGGYYTADFGKPR